MDADDLARTRRGIEAFNRGDLDTALGLMHPDVEWRLAREHPASRVLRGRDEVRAYWDEWESMVGRISTEVLDVVPGAGDRLLALTRLHTEGAAEGLGLNVFLGQVFTVRDGLAVRVEEYLDRDEAIAAAGVPAAG